MKFKIEIMYADKTVGWLAMISPEGKAGIIRCDEDKAPDFSKEAIVRLIQSPEFGVRFFILRIVAVD